MENFFILTGLKLTSHAQCSWVFDIADVSTTDPSYNSLRTAWTKVNNEAVIKMAQLVEGEEICILDDLVWAD